MDRAFSVSGAGTVVTGTALSGRISVDDNLLLVDSGGAYKSASTRSTRPNHTAETAQAGQRVALNLAGDRLKATDSAR